MSLKIPIDYCAAFTTRIPGGEDEIVMADNAYYPPSSSTLTSTNFSGLLCMDISGTFEERPVKVNRMNKRIDVYWSVSQKPKILAWLQSNFKVTILDQNSVSVGPNPIPFTSGPTFIPLKGVQSSEFIAVHASMTMPRWQMSGNNVRCFLDVEEDTRVHGIQYHLGVRFPNANQRSYSTSTHSFYESSGQINLNRSSVQVLLSYIHHFP